MKVLKFGGSSVATPERIKDIGVLIADRHRVGEELTIVFSAFGGVTDTLIQAATEAAAGELSYKDTVNSIQERHNEAIAELELSGKAVASTVQENFDTLQDLLKGVYLVREASSRTMDYILSFGERNSADIIAAYFKSIGIDAIYLDAREVIKTNKDFGKAKVKLEQTDQLIQDYYANHKGQLSVVTGFIAADKGGLTTTLGRGGSDYTAALIAGALDAEVLR